MRNPTVKNLIAELKSEKETISNYILIADNSDSHLIRIAINEANQLNVLALIGALEKAKQQLLDAVED